MSKSNLCSFQEHLWKKRISPFPFFFLLPPGRGHLMVWARVAILVPKIETGSSGWQHNKVKGPWVLNTAELLYQAHGASSCILTWEKNKFPSCLSHTYIIWVFLQPLSLFLPLWKYSRIKKVELQGWRLWSFKTLILLLNLSLSNYHDHLMKHSLSCLCSFIMQTFTFNIFKP